jgi:uncharacterized membrane protein YqaE (UPF0057 family)
MKAKYILTSCLLAIFISSCAYLDKVQIEKRHYGKGYYVHVTKDRETAPVAFSGQPAPETTPAFSGADQANAPANASAARKAENASVKNARAKTVKKTVSAVVNKISTSPAPAITQKLQGQKPAPASSDEDLLMLILLVILAFIIPPLAVFIKEGGSKRFLIILILFLIGWLGWFLFGYLAFIAAVIAVVWALLIVFDVL